MFILLPKHKGTEKLQSDLKQKISRARDDLEGAKTGGKKVGVIISGGNIDPALLALAQVERAAVGT